MDRKEFDNAVKQIIKMRLTDRKIKVNNLNGIQIDFEEETLENIIDKYLKLRVKYFLIDKKMNVIFSKELKRKMWSFTKNQLEVINEIKTKIEMNQSIKPYLSNGLYLNKFSKCDGLFEKENIYHVHLGFPDRKEHFVTRTDKLLFFTYDLENVYFLDVKKHPVGDEWNDISAIKIKNELGIKNDIRRKMFGTKNQIMKKLNELYEDKDDNSNIKSKIQKIIME